jgi:hypothetical protein
MNFKFYVKANEHFLGPEKTSMQGSDISGRRRGMEPHLSPSFLSGLEEFRDKLAVLYKRGNNIFHFFFPIAETKYLLSSIFPSISMRVLFPSGIGFTYMETKQIIALYIASLSNLINATLNLQLSVLLIKLSEIMMQEMSCQKISHGALPITKKLFDVRL